MISRTAIPIYRQREIIITDKAQYFVLCTLMIQIEGIHLCTKLVFLLYTVYDSYQGRNKDSGSNNIIILRWSTVRFIRFLIIYISSIRTKEGPIYKNIKEYQVLIYNRISKRPVLAIEVDGYENHQEGTAQYLRDRLKDHILELYQIPLLRFQTNGSGEKERIRETLKSLSQ